MGRVEKQERGFGGLGRSGNPAPEAQQQPILVVSQDITGVPGWAICGGGGGS